jgi:hypothetical protein
MTVKQIHLLSSLDYRLADFQSDAMVKMPVWPNDCSVAQGQLLSIPLEPWTVIG